MQRRAAVVGLDVDVGAALHEHPHDVHRLRPLPDGLVKHGPTGVVLGVHVHARLGLLFSDVALFHGNNFCTDTDR